jgi:hypothetical protein
MLHAVPESGLAPACGSAGLWERRPRRDAATDQALHRCEGAAPTLPSRLCPGSVEMINSLVFVGAPPSARCGDRSSAASLRGRSSHTLSRPCPGPVEVVKSLVLMGEPCLCGSASSLWERRPRRDAATDQALHRCEGAAPTLPSRLCPGPVEMIKSLVFVGAPPSARCGDRSSAASPRGRGSHLFDPSLALLLSEYS